MLKVLILEARYILPNHSNSVPLGKQRSEMINDNPSLSLGRRRDKDKCEKSRCVALPYSSFL
jgi:hypothetical protein